MGGGAPPCRTGRSVPSMSSLPVLLDRHRVVPLGPELVEHGRELLDAGFEGADALVEPDGLFQVVLRPALVEVAIAETDRSGGGIRGGRDTPGFFYPALTRGLAALAPADLLARHREASLSRRPRHTRIIPGVS